MWAWVPPKEPCVDLSFIQENHEEQMKGDNLKIRLKRGQFVAVPEINHMFSPEVVDILGFVG